MQKQLDDCLKLGDSGFLRQNRHVERDPNCTIKFKDGGVSIMEELEIDQEEEKQSESTDIILFLMKQFNESK